MYYTKSPPKSKPTFGKKTTVFGKGECKQLSFLSALNPFCKERIVNPISTVCVAYKPFVNEPRYGAFHRCRTFHPRNLKEIARILNIGNETVKQHMSTILLRLHASSRAEAAAQALSLGLITA